MSNDSYHSIRTVPCDWEHPFDEEGEELPVLLSGMPKIGEGERGCYMVYTNDGYPCSRKYKTTSEVEAYLSQEWVLFINSGFMGYE